MKIKKNKKINEIKKAIINPIQTVSRDNSSSSIKINIKNSQNLPGAKIGNHLKLETNAKYTDYELNHFCYENALKYDKRIFFGYYISLLKSKHPLFFIFCFNDDYNSRIVKISIFLIFFSFIYNMNSIFFNEDIIHLIYIEGVYKIIYLFPEIFYSFIISQVLFLIIRYFFLSERNILDIKREENINNAYDKVDGVKRCLIIKYLCFYIFGTIILVFFWYLLSSFGAVYRNTQIHLIKNTFATLAIAFVYPFIINLLPSTFRIISLRDINHNRQYMYIFSKIIQFI